MENDLQKESINYFIVIFGPPASGKTTLAHKLLSSIRSTSSELSVQLISVDCCQEYLRTHSTQELEILLEKEEGWNQLKNFKLKRSFFDAQVWKLSRNFIKNSLQKWNKRWNILIVEDDLLLKSQRKQMRQLVQHSHVKYVELYCHCTFEQCLNNLHQRVKMESQAQQISKEKVKECFDKFQREESVYCHKLSRQTPISWCQIQKLTKQVIIQHPEEKEKNVVSEECQAKDNVQTKIRTFISEIITDINLRKKYFGERPTKQVAALLSKIKKGAKEKDKSFQSFLGHLERQTSKLI